MSWGEEQKKEIETIRERKITVKLSDADCDRLARKCGEHGLTIGELIENFVGDLVGGTYSNGSDERDYADQWFERCWFGMFPEPTLLNHLLNFGYEPEHYLDMLENVETIKSDIEITKQNIAEPSDEWKDIVYHKYNDDRTSYECVPCYNSVDEYIASEKEDLETESKAIPCKVTRRSLCGIALEKGVWALLKQYTTADRQIKICTKA